jgi:hypothetical protein
MKIGFIITVFNREEYLPFLLRIIRGYKKISPEVAVCYNGDKPEFLCDVSIKNNGHQQGDMDLTVAGYNRLVERGVFRFVKIGVDSWMLDESVIVKIFERMEKSRCGYAGNRWNGGEDSLATDIIFCDARFGNVFEGLSLDGFPAFEQAMYGACLRKKIKILFLDGRNPVHPFNRHEVESYKWTMHHRLSDNLLNAKRWGQLLGEPCETEGVVSHYRLGDLCLLDLTDEEKRLLCEEAQNSIGHEVAHYRAFKNIPEITKIVERHIKKNKSILPVDIGASTVVHLRLGDVVAGNEPHEREKRPSSPSAVALSIPSGQPAYFLGKKFFAKTSSTNVSECLSKSDEYLKLVAAEARRSSVDVRSFSGGHADVDLCCAVSSRHFVVGKGYFSSLIAKVRSQLGLPSITPAQ